MSLKRSSRLLKLLMMLQSENYKSPELLSEGLNVSKRTLYRDLQTLQEAGIPCYFDHAEGYYKVSSNFFMPPPNLTEHEAFSLLLLVHRTQQCLNIPFSRHIYSAALKIESQLPRGLKEYCRQKLKNISVWPVPAKSSKLFDDTFAKLQHAIQNKRILNISYHCKTEQKIVNCGFSPMHIIYTNAWHVIGKENINRTTRTIKLDSIEKIEQTEKNFFESDKFDPAEYYGRAWSTLPEGRLYNVSLKFAPQIANEVTAVQWHSTQYAAAQDDGSVILEFRVDGLDEISSWIFGFGDKVQVLSPEILRDKICKMAYSVIKQYDLYQIKNSDLSLQGTA